MKAQYRLQETNEQGQTGLVRPSTLQFSTEDEGTLVAKRYEEAFPKSKFVVVKIDRNGYIIK